VFAKQIFQALAKEVFDRAVRIGREMFETTMFAGIDNKESRAVSQRVMRQNELSPALPKRATGLVSMAYHLAPASHFAATGRPNGSMSWR
jgi:hypothetical protein